MTDKKIPFVGLHAHSVAGSIFDAIGYPDEHMDFCYENGGEALALTDHGNMNGFSHQFLHWQKMQGRRERNSSRSLAWKRTSSRPLKNGERTIIALRRTLSLRNRLQRQGDTSGATVEDEDASKKAIKSVINRRRHLVLLAQNQTGLNNLFKLISESIREENFYRYPRVDYRLSGQVLRRRYRMRLPVWADLMLATIGLTERKVPKQLWKQ